MNLLLLYRTATRLAGPIVRGLVARRTRRGKEDPLRRSERFGHASLPRPHGPLVWAHAASVGESLSLLPLLQALLGRAPSLEILVTSGTVTSAKLLADRLPPRARHQYVPLDLPGAVDRFLDHWRPDLALWVESELWPNLVAATRARQIPMALINARMSAKSAQGWRRAPGMIKSLLDCFDIVLAQDAVQAERLKQLGALRAGTVGDLKSAAEPPGADPGELQRLSAVIGQRPVWLAASTHEGEEAIVAEAHALLKPRHPSLLTLLAPRHPARGDTVLAGLGAKGLSVARRSQNAAITPETDIYLVDTMGEMGLFYRLGGIVLVAGSLLPPGAIGGHNPMEAAGLGAAILHGPDMVNCAANAAALDEAGGALLVHGAEELAHAVGDLLSRPDARAAMGTAALDVATRLRHGIIDRIVERLEPWLARFGGLDAGA